MTPTERQLADYTKRPFAERWAIAVDCLVAVRQRALRLRDANRKYPGSAPSQFRSSARARIYDVTGRLLEAAALAGRVKVRTFTWNPTHEWHCDQCGRSWRGADGQCFRCHVQATQGEPARWWLYLVGDHQFLQPTAPEGVQQIATRCVPMNPASLAREVPPSGYTAEAELAIVAAMAEELRV